MRHIVLLIVTYCRVLSNTLVRHSHEGVRVNETIEHEHVKLGHLCRANAPCMALVLVLWYHDLTLLGGGG